MWERRNELLNITNHYAYAAKILTNICLDKWRAANKYTQDNPPEDIPDIWNEDYEVYDFERFTILYINKLPDTQQRVMKMRMQGASTEEITETTGLSTANIRTILSRVRKKLKEIYNKELWR